MKRFHVHLHVDDLAKNIHFYSQLFDAEPTRTELDYAKWMLEDPPVNFAISTRGEAPGVDHLGIQTDSEEELLELKARAEKADLALLDEGATTCCYAKSEKHWITDPQGMAWEHFRTLGNIPVFREKSNDPTAAACCAPASSSTKASGGAESSTTQASNCCSPTGEQAQSASCCSPSTNAQPGTRCC